MGIATTVRTAGQPPLEAASHEARTPGSSAPRPIFVGPRGRISWAEVSIAFFSVVIHACAVTHNIWGWEIKFNKHFDMLLGIPSPTSGTTRAIWALDRGAFADAMLYNPVAALAGVFMWIFPAYLVVTFMSGRKLETSHRLNRWFLWLSLSALVACWVVKLAWVPHSHW